MIAQNKSDKQERNLIKDKNKINKEESKEFKK